MKTSASFYTLIFLLFITFSFGFKNKKILNSKSPEKVSANCTPTTAQVDLNINNVRARILNGGDLWWNYNNNSTGIYEIPTGSGKNSIYAGAIWIGGYDASSNLKVAAQTYRQGGANDFWAGPIAKDISNNLDVSTTTCNTYNRFWNLNKAQVYTFATGGASTPDILSWPGNGNVANGELPFLAPFFDSNNNGLYESLSGDYPYYLFTGSPTGSCNGFLYGDQTIWWVFNDIGNVHTETNSLFPIGVEIRAQAFAFQTANTDINNSTFYEYQVINRSSDNLLNTYFGVWCDADLGDASDDYVGCDVGLGLGYCYNGDNNDGTSIGYGIDPPAIGIDFFQGPLADANDGIDNDRDGTTDESGEEIHMAHFHYYYSDFSATNGNPQSTDDYYQYLSGMWRDSTPVTYGGYGMGFGPGATTTPCNFMFPGTSDPLFPTDWTMVTAGMAPDDMRFLESAGPFTMDPGEVNYITTGVVWARAIGGGPLGSLAALKTADIAIQQLFNSCFVVGINEHTDANSYSLYPNPSINSSLLKFNNEEGKNVTLKLYTSSGTLVNEISNITNGEVLIETKGLEKGLYIFTISGTEKLKTSGKLTVL